MILKKSSSGRAAVLIILPGDEDLRHLADPVRLAKVQEIWAGLAPRGSVVIDLPRATARKTERPRAQKVAL